MRDRLIELLDECRGIEGIGRELLEKIADHLLANGVIALPCKVGDKVYWLGWLNQLVEGDVVRIGACFTANVEECDIEFDVLSEDIGKTVFLTREEAEKALKEAEG